ncbi:MAG: 50S ribosomal protein L29 [Nanobdellota archaeon]
MKYKELKDMTADQRASKLKESRLELAKLQAQVSAGTPPKNPGKIKLLKKLIARLNSFEHDSSRRDVK